MPILMKLSFFEEKAVVELIPPSSGVNYRREFTPVYRQGGIMTLIYEKDNNININRHILHQPSNSA